MGGGQRQGVDLVQIEPSALGSWPEPSEKPLAERRLWQGGELEREDLIHDPVPGDGVSDHDQGAQPSGIPDLEVGGKALLGGDRNSTRLNSSH